MCILWLFTDGANCCHSSQGRQQFYSFSWAFSTMATFIPQAKKKKKNVRALSTIKQVFSNLVFREHGNCHFDIGNCPWTRTLSCLTSVRGPTMILQVFDYQCLLRLGSNSPQRVWIFYVPWYTHNYRPHQGSKSMLTLETGQRIATLCWDNSFQSPDHTYQLALIEQCS